MNSITPLSFFTDRNTLLFTARSCEKIIILMSVRKILCVSKRFIPSSSSSLLITSDQNNILIWRRLRLNENVCIEASNFPPTSYHPHTYQLQHNNSSHHISLCWLSLLIQIWGFLMGIIQFNNIIIISFDARVLSLKEHLCGGWVFESTHKTARAHSLTHSLTLSSCKFSIT